MQRAKACYVAGKVVEGEDGSAGASLLFSKIYSNPSEALRWIMDGRVSLCFKLTGLSLDDFHTIKSLKKSTTASRMADILKKGKDGDCLLFNWKSKLFPWIKEKDVISVKKLCR